MDVTFDHIYNYDDDNDQLGDEFFNDNDQESSDDDDDEDDNGPQYELPKHERCLSHTLNLIATTDVGKVKFGKKSVHHVAMGRVTGLWNKCNKSQLSSEIIVD